MRLSYCVSEDGQDVVVDIDGKENDEIQEHLIGTLCKSSYVSIIGLFYYI